MTHLGIIVYLNTDIYTMIRSTSTEFSFLSMPVLSYITMDKEEKDIILEILATLQS